MSIWARKKNWRKTFHFSVRDAIAFLLSWSMSKFLLLVLRLLLREAVKSARLMRLNGGRLLSFTVTIYKKKKELTETLVWLSVKNVHVRVQLHCLNAALFAPSTYTYESEMKEFLMLHHRNVVALHNVCSFEESLTLENILLLLWKHE